MMHGILVVDKPLGITSRDAVNRAARRFPKRTKIGHAGTLDPAAEGVLVLAVGSATRLIEFIQEGHKSYDAEITLGAVSDTDDRDGVVTPTAGVTAVSDADVRSALEKFVGHVMQAPPSYSAVHVEGRRAYDLARRGEAVVPTARPIRIDAITVVSYEWPVLRCTVDCGKGTYIRSIARDLGVALGCGGYLSALRRTRVGPFTIDQAHPLDSVERNHLLPARSALAGRPMFTVGPAAVADLRTGKRIDLSAERFEPGIAVVLDSTGELVAVGEVTDRGLFQPHKVLA